MTKFYTNIEGNQWSGFCYSVSYICDNCGKKVKDAQIQGESLEVYDKYNHCPYCGSPAPEKFPIYLTNGKWYNPND